jgi:hypothetical protein
MPNQSQKGSISILLILLIILGAVGGLFYYGVTKGNLLKTSDPNLDTTQKFDEQMTQSSDIDTSNWKTYTNKYSNYEIKYPSAGKLMDCDGHCNYDAQLDFENLHIAFVSQGIPNETTIEDPKLYGFCSTTKNSNPQINQIAGINFYTDKKVITNDNLCAEYIAKLENVSFTTDSHSYWVIELQTRATNKEGQELLDQILSTFKFTDSPSQEQTTTSNPNQPTISTPKANTKVSNPLTIKGTAPSNWFFEGQLHIRLVDDKRNTIAGASGDEVTPGSWMEDKPVEFTGIINFKTTAKSGYLIIENDNPSGLPENQKMYEIPVSF